MSNQQKRPLLLVLLSTALAGIAISLGRCDFAALFFAIALGLAVKELTAAINSTLDAHRMAVDPSGRIKPTVVLTLAFVAVLLPTMIRQVIFN